MIGYKTLLAPMMLFGMLILTGCDSGPTRYGVSGTVKFKGEPLKDGIIQFVPVPSGPTSAGPLIVDGNYTIPRDKGLVAGKYRIVINSGDGKTPTDPNIPPGPTGNFASKDRIPLEWNQESKHEVEVTAAGPNKFDFDIK